MGKLKKIAVVVVLGLVLAYGASISLFIISDKEAIKTTFQEAIKASFGYEVEIQGDIEARAFATPSMRFNDIVVYSSHEGANVQVGTIAYMEVKPKLFSFVMGGMEVGLLTIGDSKFSAAFFDHIQLSDELLDRKMLSNVVIKNSMITFMCDYCQKEEDGQVVTHTIDKISGTLAWKDSTQSLEVAGRGYFLDDVFSYELSLSYVDNTRVLATKLDSTLFEIGFNGNLPRGSFAGGKGEFTLSVLPNKEASAVNGIESGIVADHTLFTGNVIFTDTGFQISNSTLDSSYVHNASFNVEAIFDSVPLIDVHIEGAQLDFDKLASAEKTFLHHFAEYLVTNTLSVNFKEDLLWKMVTSPTKTLNLLMDVSFNEVMFNGETISSFNLNTELFNADLMVNDFSAQLPFGTSMAIEGDVYFNEEGPLFKGNGQLTGGKILALIDWLGGESLFNMQGQDVEGYNLQADIEAGIKRITLSNLAYQRNDEHILGEVTVLLTKEEPYIFSQLYARNLDYQQYKPVLRHFNPHANFASLNWLRFMRKRLDLDFFGVDLHLDEQLPVEKVSGIMQLYPSYLNMDKFHFTAPWLQNVKGTFSASAQEVRPRVVGEFTSDYYMSDFVFDHFIETLKPQVDERDFYGLAPTATQEAQHWIDKNLDFRLLGSSDGNVKANFKRVRHYNLDIEDLETDFILNGGQVTMNSFKGQTGKDSYFSLRAVMNIAEPPIMAMNFVTSNMDIKQLVRGVDAVVLPVSGRLSLSGTASIAGPTVAHWIKGMNSEFNVSAARLKFKGADIDRVLTTIDGFGSVTDISEARSVALISQLREVARASAYKGTTDIASVEGRFKIVNGLLDLQEISIYNDKIQGLLTGKVALFDKKMNLIYRFLFVPLWTEDTISMDLATRGDVLNPEVLFLTEAMEGVINAR